MKKTLLICLSLFTLKFFSQEETRTPEKNQDYDLYISAGLHVGLWNLTGNTNLPLENTPYNFHIDKVFSHKYAIGIGYSHDKFEHSPIEFFNASAGILRQNIRIRYYNYLTDYDKTFSIYMGLSAGCSIWTSQYSSKNTYWPSAQFLFGMKVKLSDTFFWQTEFAVGPPYACQTSFGIKF